jgi:hypothetical protein
LWVQGKLGCGIEVVGPVLQATAGDTQSRMSDWPLRIYLTSMQVAKHGRCLPSHATVWHWNVDAHSMPQRRQRIPPM